MPSVSAHDIGNPAQPGEYLVDGAYYQVDHQHLEAWRVKPETVFRTIICTSARDPRERYALGAEHKI